MLDVNVNIRSPRYPDLDLALQFLNAPISGSDVHAITDAHQWHARLMVLGWGVLIPTGILVARYFKVLRAQDWPRQLDNRRWWHAHLALQCTGMVLSLVALGLAFFASGAAGSGILPPVGVTVHETLGWAIVTLGLGQVLGGALRGTKGEGGSSAAAAARRPRRDALVGSPAGDHYLMTARRCAFEYLHKASGYLALALSAINILLGLAISDAPVWMWIAIPGYWAVLGAVAVALQRQGRCVDTYQAIYGPDVQLPGNARAPIGWGVRRYEIGQWPPARPAASRRRARSPAGARAGSPAPVERASPFGTGGPVIG